jgi:hypothetical protein
LLTYTLFSRESSVAVAAGMSGKTLADVGHPWYASA